MPVFTQADIIREASIEGKTTRFIAHTHNLMMVVITFEDGPKDKPDPPHSHPHEQITYVAEGELFFYLDGDPTRVGPGDVITVPPDVPHSIHRLTKYVKLIDTFHPLRDDFLS